MATVRIAADLNDVLKAQAAADPQGRSVTQLVDHHLRLATRMASDQIPDMPAVVEQSKPRARASVGRPRARAAATAGPNAKCPHPIGRRVGGSCLVCGASVG